MEIKRKLHVDLPESIPQLRYALKEFEIKKKIYKIFYRGKSFEFDGYRPYTGEDDVTSIDWKASIRANNLIVKQYKEEEDMKILFVIDVGENMVSGSSDKLKCEYAAEIILSLAHMIIVAGHRVGFVLYNSKVSYILMPKRGIRNFYLFADVLTDSKTYGRGSNINGALDFVMKNFDNSLSSIILVSDFLSLNRDSPHYIELLTSRFETIALVIRDPIDMSLPDVKGEFVVENPHTGAQLLIDPQVARASYSKHAREQENFMKETFKTAGIDFIELFTGKNFVSDLVFFLKNRMRGR